MLDSQTALLFAYAPHVTIFHLGRRLFEQQLGFSVSLHYESNDHTIAVLMLIQMGLNSLERC